MYSVYVLGRATVYISDMGSEKMVFRNINKLLNNGYSKKEQFDLSQFPVLLENKLSVEKAVMQYNIPLATAQCVFFHQYHPFLVQVIELIIYRELVIDIQVLLILNMHLEILDKYLRAYFTDVTDKPYLNQPTLYIYSKTFLFPEVPNK